MIKKNSFKETKTIELELSYLSYFPKNYRDHSNEKYPLLLFLHGMGESGNHLDDLYRTGLPKMLKEGNEIPFVAIMPQCPKDSFWTEETAALKALVDHMISTLPIDETRVYITGLSMGGYGTYEMLIRYPKTFAAGIPICGGLGSLYSRINVLNLKDKPLWIFHGEKDPVVSINESTSIIDTLKIAHSKNLKYTFYPELGHDSWTKTYQNYEIFSFLLQHITVNK